MNDFPTRRPPSKVIRVIDVLLASAAIVAVSPLLILIIPMLMLTGEGEVFFGQPRVGLYGKMFRLWKFATMLKQSPHMGTGVLTVKNDPRVLPTGRFMRKTKLNELPQLFNILIGDMSFIGPRPQALANFLLYPAHVQTALKAVKPGLSGIGSILFRDEETIVSCALDKQEFYAQVVMPYKGDVECWFIENFGIRLYLLLGVLTLWVVVFPRSGLQWRLFPDLPSPPPEIATPGAAVQQSTSSATHNQLSSR